MFDRFTNPSRDAIVRAQEEARALGHASISNGHLLLGLVATTGTAATVLASFALDVPRVRAVVAAQSPRGAQATGAIPLQAGTKRTLEGALRESLGLGHHDIATAHLLLGLLRDGHGRAFASSLATLAALGVDPAALTTATLNAIASAAPEGRGTSEHPDGSESGGGSESLAGSGAPVLPALGDAPPLPGRAASLRRIAAAALAFVGICAVIALLGGPDGAEAAVLGSVLMIFALIIVPAILMLRPGRARSRCAGKPPAPTVVAPDIARSLATCGVTTVEIYMPAKRVRRPNLGFGVGRFGFIRVSPILMASPSGRFVLAHEVAHVARRDSILMTFSTVASLYLVVASAATLNLEVFLLGTLGGLVFAAGCRWGAEIGCDRIATRWVGRDAAQLGFTVMRNGMRLLRRKPVGFVRWALAWRTHPPVWLRRRLALR